jgi:hypothetical protein
MSINTHSISAKSKKRLKVLKKTLKTVAKSAVKRGALNSR